MLLAELVAEDRRVVPTDLFHRAIVATSIEIAWVRAKQSHPLPLCHFILAHIKIGERDLVSGAFVAVAIGRLLGGAAHGEGTALHEDHVRGEGGLARGPEGGDEGEEGKEDVGP